MHIRKGWEVQTEKDFKVFHVESHIVNAISLIHIQLGTTFIFVILRGRPYLQGINHTITATDCVDPVAAQIPAKIFVLAFRVNKNQLGSVHKFRHGNVLDGGGLAHT